MKNIFSQTKDYVKPPKRNVFDLSFRNNGTYQFGYLYPVFCKEVIPGDSFKIDPTFALRFLPTAFPIQTKINANLHFFYVRNRNLWEGWQKFIGHTADVEFPFLSGTQDSIRTSGLGDYLGVPTTVISGPSYLSELTYPRLFSNDDSNTFLSYRFNKLGFSAGLDYSILFGGSSLDSISGPQVTGGNNYSNRFISTMNYGIDNVTFSDTFYLVANTGVATAPNVDLLDFDIILSTIFDDTTSSPSAFPELAFGVHGNIIDKDPITGKSTIEFKLTPDTNFYHRSDLGATPLKFGSSSEIVSYLNGLFSGHKVSITLYQPTTLTGKSSILPATQTRTAANGQRYVYSMGFVSGSAGLEDLVDIPDDRNPFIASNESNVRLSALPFRAYESIYNAFYRNDQNDPLMIDGQPEYDTYVPNTNGGSDSYPYQLYKRNWELDFLTSAVQSPQQGIAPLVGVSQSGDFTFVHKDSDGNIGYFSAKASLASDGSSITGVELSDKVTLDGLPTTPITADIPEDVKRGSIYSLKQMALAGISINDFRNVNALQRWLETNIRRGYKYRDQIKSHFGIDLDYQVLDMPEFIGGVSQAVYSSQVNQTTETETDPLGSYAGQLSLIASSNHSIKHYCHEHGFIIGIFSVTPVPNYSQLLPKHFIKYNYLDYYFPEFGHIGMQPIDYREVCPLQAYGVNPQNVLNTFGYQRPWYDYIASVDEVHGLFRTNLRNFVLNRQFATLPVLNKDFLQVDPDQLNDVFTIDDVSDKILGQIQFNVIAKRPIPKFGIPRLE